MEGKDVENQKEPEKETKIKKENDNDQEIEPESSQNPEAEILQTRIERQADLWKNRLLDTTLKNKLLNFKPSKTSLEIISPGLLTLFNELVLERKSLSFSQSEQKENAQSNQTNRLALITNQSPGEQRKILARLASEAKTISDERGIHVLYLAFGLLAWNESKKDVNENEMAERESLQTNNSEQPAESAVQNTQKNERQEKRESLKEPEGQISDENNHQGLEAEAKGQEISKNDLSKEELVKAPLILVPVVLSKTSAQSPVLLSLSPGEIVVNPTLAYKLESRFDLKLPEFNDKESKSLKDYLEKIRTLIRPKGWKVLDQAVLSIFQFYKINIFHDLQRHRNEILSNPIIQTICQNETALDHDLSFLDKPDYNGPLFENLLQVVEADSSQLEALLCAQKGLSFILQGPPGTGKSQTITNMIASALSENKKVLFVSEKRAALDVVYKRLKQTGLADFALVLHGDTNRKEIYQNLEKTLRLADEKGQPGTLNLEQNQNQNTERTTELDTAASINQDEKKLAKKLARNKEQLEGYVKALHSPVSPLRLSFYQVFGELASLEKVPTLPFSIPEKELKEIDRESLDERVEALERLSKARAHLSLDESIHPWKGYKTNGEKGFQSHLSFDQKLALPARLNQIAAKMQTISKDYLTLQNTFRFDLKSEYICWKKDLDFIERVLSLPIVPQAWFLPGADLKELKEEILNARSNQLSFFAKAQSLLALQKKTFLGPLQSLSIAKLGSISAIHNQIGKIEDYLSKTKPFSKWKCKNNKDDKEEKEFEKARISLQSLKEELEAIQKQSDELLSIFKPEILNLNGLEYKERFGKLYPNLKKDLQSYLKAKDSLLSLSLSASFVPSSSQIHSPAQAETENREGKDGEGKVPSNQSTSPDSQAALLPSLDQMELDSIDQGDEWIVSLIKKALRLQSLEKEYKKELDRYFALKSALEKEFKPAFFSLDGRSLYQSFQKRSNKAFKALSSGYRKEKKEIEQMLLHPGKLEDQKILASLKTLSDLKELEQSLGKKRVDEYQMLQSYFETHFKPELFLLDLKSLRADFEEIYPQMLDLFENGYLPDRTKLIDLILDESNKELSDEQLLGYIEKLQALQNAKEALHSNFTYAKTFAGLYRAERTDLKLVEQKIKDFEKLSLYKERLCEFEMEARKYLLFEQSMRERFGPLYKGLDTNWNELEKAIAAISKFKESNADEIAKNQQSFDLLFPKTKQANQNPNLTSNPAAQIAENPNQNQSQNQSQNQNPNIIQASQQAQFQQEQNSNQEQNQNQIIQKEQEKQDPQKARVELEALLESLKESEQAIEPELSWFFDLFTESEAGSLKTMPVSALTKRIEACATKPGLIEEWLCYQKALQACKDLGLGEFLTLAESLQKNEKEKEQEKEKEKETETETNTKEQTKSQEQEKTEIKENTETKKPVFTFSLSSLYLKRFYQLWLDCQIQDVPEIAEFNLARQIDLEKEYRELDKLNLTLASRKLYQKLIEALPEYKGVQNGLSELSILGRELKKTRNQLPLRTLFEKIPNLLLDLKPCLMMSPLTVSLYLQSDKLHFDMVIFDEASQICTENAIAAILRGEQVIIVGDNNQLPPTNFFAASDTGEGNSENLAIFGQDYPDTLEYESILEEAALLPEKTLLWHYRSQDESLISFSNEKIYNNKLITFPSNLKDNQSGLEYVYVKDGIYHHRANREKDIRKGNQAEARKTAELILEHFQNHPENSLGVITFGTIQQQAILSELQKLEKDHPELKAHLEQSESENPEAFFVKSLENAQGDERDVIFLCIGYAKDENGKLSLNFGPLNKAGGERRLNVAITRARNQLKLIGSLLPKDLESPRVNNNPGPKLLKEYISYAIANTNEKRQRQNQNSASSTTNSQTSLLPQAVSKEPKLKFASKFEKAVYDFLIDQGYQVDTWPGNSSYRLDLAIQNPENPGSYLLGIECDGSFYQSAKTIRERERLRKEMLESMGWRLHRIYSTNWIKDEAAEKQRLLDAIEKALQEEKAIQSRLKESNLKTAGTDEIETAIEAESQSKEEGLLQGTESSNSTILDFIDEDIDLIDEEMEEIDELEEINQESVQNEQPQVQTAPQESQPEARQNPTNLRTENHYSNQSNQAKKEQPQENALLLPDLSLYPKTDQGKADFIKDLISQSYPIDRKTIVQAILPLMNKKKVDTEAQIQVDHALTYLSIADIKEIAGLFYPSDYQG